MLNNLFISNKQTSIAINIKYFSIKYVKYPNNLQDNNLLNNFLISKEPWC